MSVKSTLTINGTKYLIRGPYTETQVRERYNAFRRKYPSSPQTFYQWAAERGAIYGKHHQE